MFLVDTIRAYQFNRVPKCQSIKSCSCLVKIFEIIKLHHKVVKLFPNQIRLNTKPMVLCAKHEQFTHPPSKMMIQTRLKVGRF